MKFVLRTLIAVFAALWLAAPTVGGEGDGGEGGLGVWVLPLGSPLGGSGLAANTTRSVPNFSNDLSMVVSQELGAVVATACDPITAAMVPLSVSGRDVTFPASTMKAFRDAHVQTVEILIADPAQYGYRITFQISPSGDSGVLTIN